MSFPKRGGFAKDTRTGQAVRVTEESPGGEQWMVRPLYKTDGYWVARTHLEPGRDPHAWTYPNWVLALLLFAISGVTGGLIMNQISSLGGGLLLTMSVGLCTVSTVLSFLLKVTGLYRL